MANRCDSGQIEQGEKLTFARWYNHSHNFNADASLISFLALSDLVMVAGRGPSNANPRFPNKKKEEEAIPVKIARLNGSVARQTSCWVRDSTGPAMLSRVLLEFGGRSSRSG